MSSKASSPSGGTPTADWTVDPESGRSNSSAKFLYLVAEVARLIRGEAHSLINGEVRSTAQLIMAQLAHVHGLVPKYESGSGETGRRTGLKSLGSNDRAGSSPASPTKSGQARASRSLPEPGMCDTCGNIPFGKSLVCEHSEQYLFTEDGGKHIVCLLCERASEGEARSLIQPIKDAKDCKELPPVQHAIHFLRHLVEHGYLPQMSRTEAEQLIERLVGEARSVPAPEFPNATPGPWISCAERMPPEGDVVLIAHATKGTKSGTQPPANHVWFGKWWDGRWQRADMWPGDKYLHADITHWQAMPAHPVAAVNAYRGSVSEQKEMPAKGKL